VNFSGAGLIFHRSNHFYLTGVTSVMDLYTDGSLLQNSLKILTNVHHYAKWIRKIYDKYSSNVSIFDSTDISIIILI